MWKSITSIGQHVQGIGTHRLMALVLAGALAGCGSNVTSDEAVILVETIDSEYGTFDRPSNSFGLTFSTVGPVIFRVVKSETDHTPVAGATVAIQVGGSSLQNADLRDPVNGTLLDDTSGLFLTQSDSRGVVKVTPLGTSVDCLPIAAGEKNLTFDGFLGVAAFVAADIQSWKGTFKINCIAPAAP